MKKGTLIVLSGSSGVGKSTVLAKVLKAHPDIYFSVSFTTRVPRPGERDGVNYYFVDRAEFEQRIEQDEFLEYAEYVGNYYGTSMKAIHEKLEKGVDVLLDIEVQGAANVKARCPEAVTIFMIPPSFHELERRLRARKTDDDAKIISRLERARQEFKEIPNYDYMVVNDRIENAVGEIETILTAASYRTPNRIYLTEGV